MAPRRARRSRRPLTLWISVILMILWVAILGYAHFWLVRQPALPRVASEGHVFRGKVNSITRPPPLHDLFKTPSPQNRIENLLSSRMSEKVHAACVGGSNCPQSPANLLFYNDFDQARYICGQKVEASATVSLPVSCRHSVFVNAHEAAIQQEAMPPIVLRFPNGKSAKKTKLFKDCDVPCEEAGSFASVVTERFVDGTDWRFTFSMEGPQYYTKLKRDPLGYQSNHFFATTSFDSEVPLPYYSEAEYKIFHTNPVSYDEAIHGAVFLARNCNSRNNREQILNEMQSYADQIRVDSLSSCCHNKDPPRDYKMGNKTDVMRRYLFYLAFENQNEPDYITEKLWGPLEAGTIPVYFGAPNAKDHAPKHSVIFVSDFASTADLVTHLQQVAANKTLYESYHSWRATANERFHDKYDLTRVHATCRMCRWAFAKKYGLGWDAKDQSLRPLRTPRSLCLNAPGLVTAPVQEAWSSDVEITSMESSIEGCEQNRQPRTVRVGAALERTVVEHDGVIDFHIEVALSAVAPSPISFQLTVALTNAISAVLSPQHLRTQDGWTRVTILGDDHVTLTLVDSSISVSISDYPARVRVVAEDVDRFHEGAQDIENYFGVIAKNEFQNPVRIMDAATR